MNQPLSSSFVRTISSRIGLQVFAQNQSIYPGQELSGRKALDFIAEIVGSPVGEQTVQNIGALPSGSHCIYRSEWRRAGQTAAAIFLNGHTTPLHYRFQWRQAR
jgi:hypothetical protein